MQKVNKPTVTAHVLVKNEENYIWYAITSVLPYVDKMIIFDTGSTDKTIGIIKDIVAKDKDKKIIFEEKGEVDKQKHTDLRNEMIKRTKTDWFMILDGDEVWPDDQIKFLIKKDIPAAEKLKRNCIMVSYHLCAVDLYHYTERGHYTYKWNLHGHLMPRFFKYKNDLLFKGVYGSDTVYYEGKILVNLQSEIFLSTTFYWHLSKLKRSTKDMAVFSRIKSPKALFLPKFIKKLFLKSTNGIPQIFIKE